VMVYDVHAPLFGDITPQTTNNWTKLMIEASDPGEFASGVNVSSIRVTYRLEPAEPTDPWNTAVTFSTGYNTFAAEFPELPPDSIVNFRIEIKDKEGNRADIDGKFTTFTGDDDAVDGEGPVDDTQNQTNAQVTEPEMQEIPPFYIVGGAILMILIVYMVIRLKRMASGSV